MLRLPAWAAPIASPVALTHVAARVYAARICECARRRCGHHGFPPPEPLPDAAGGPLALGGIDLAAEVDDTLGGVDADLGSLHPLVGEERDLGLGGEPAIADHCLGCLRRGLRLLVGCARRQRGRNDECRQDRCRNRSTVPHSPILLTNRFNATYSPATRRCLVAGISRRFPLRLPAAVDRAPHRGAVRRSGGPQGTGTR